MSKTLVRIKSTGELAIIDGININADILGTKQLYNANIVDPNRDFEPTGFSCSVYSSDIEPVEY